MAGAGYRLFNTGDVLTAAQVNTFLQEQVVMVFANATARTTALSGVLAEGMMSYLQDTNAVEVYDGSAWVSVGSTGDITGVTAGTGISGGGTSGTVTITNSMATAIDAKGDLIVGTGADTFSRLAVGGTNGHVLKVNSSTSTGLEWGAAGAAGALTKITANLAFSGANAVSIDNCFTSTYTNYLILIENLGTAANQTDVRMRLRTSGTDNSGASYQQGNQASLYASTTVNENGSNQTSFLMMGAVSTVAAKGTMALFMMNPQTATTTTWSGNGSNNDATYRVGGQFTANTQFDGFKLYGNENLTGNITVYGLEK